MNEQEFVLRIKQELDLGSHRLPPLVQLRLQAARHGALDRKPARVEVLTFAGVGRLFEDHARKWLAPLATAAALSLMMFAGSQLTADQQALEIEEIDSALLSDDLPIDAYLDRGFVTWLKRDSSG